MATDSGKNDLARADVQAVRARWKGLPHLPHPDLQGAVRDDELGPAYRGSVENYMGTVRVPFGIAGPLRVHGSRAKGDYYVPMATTEAALVASYSRGCKALSASGGCRTALLAEGAARAPYFEFDSLVQAQHFMEWVPSVEDQMRRAVEVTSRGGHVRLLDVTPTATGKAVMLLLRLTTGNAAGQNMATFAADAVIDIVKASSPVQPRRYYNDAKGVDGDKVCTSNFFSPFHLRGRRVVVEAVLTADVVARMLRTKPEEMVAAHRALRTGRRLGGDQNDNAMCCNALAAIFIACGQDPACVIESSAGHLNMEVASCGGLYVSLLMPNLLVGTVGGGTCLPSQRACLDILLRGGAPEDPGRAGELGEVVAACCLAGELSVIAAMATGDFSRGHRELRERSRL
mmetsp:Transcript_12684/g.35076  ORF Transcript_12684/g.35076 Transcript_12684/m.35076 type:complete len:401 (-) Transcript_12684:78-1280(-)